MSSSSFVNPVKPTITPPSQSPAFDLIILTAANPAQASGYRVQLQKRQDEGLLPGKTRFLVVCDPGNRRVGSGTGTLWAWREAARFLRPDARSWHEAFAGLRVLVAHSGGDARRIPAYAAQGKIFLPLPCDVPPFEGALTPRPATIFDVFLRTLMSLPAPGEGELLVCSGDVLLTFDPSYTPLAVPRGVGGLGFAVAPLVGTSHGVYRPENPSLGGQVADFLQKPSLQTLQESGALDATGRVLIDTGVFSFAPSAVEIFARTSGLETPKSEPIGVLAAILAGDLPIFDLYREMALALVPSMTSERYAREISPENHGSKGADLLPEFFETIRAASIPFGVAAVADGEFFHIGNTRDLLSRLVQPSRTAWQNGFRSGHRALPLGEQAPARAGATVFNTLGALPVSGGAFYLEGSHLNHAEDLVLTGENVVVGLHDAPPIQLPRGVGLVVMPIETPSGIQNVPALFGLSDDNKKGVQNGGIWLDKAWDFWFRSGVQSEKIWPHGGEQSSWTAKLWLAGEDGWAQVHTILQALENESPLELSTENALSWADLAPLVSHEEILARRAKIEARFEAHTLFESVLNNPDFPVNVRLQSLRARLGAESGDWATRFESQLEIFLREKSPSPLERARLLRAAALVETDPARADIWKSRAFEGVAQAVESSLVLEHEPRPAAILHDQAVWVTAPARIDFAGGWSDTPPICLERGGTVLNAAVTLNGQYPIQVVAKLNHEGYIRLTSIDLGQQEIYREAHEINGPPSLGHWSSLAKAALVLTGIVPERGQSGSLASWLETLGGGLDLTLFSGLPKGSGMGTSSILGAATLACLSRVLGEERTHAELIAQTSLLEQRLTSGGGWQDQVGGIVAGVKLIRTQPGLEQKPSMSWTVFGPTGAASEGLQRRMLLYFTGQKRLAANILQHVVGRYLEREPEALRLIEQLKIGAEEAKMALEAGDLAAFAARVDEYWELKKALDPGSTNENVEAILSKVQKYTSAKLLCGAGGGGFILMIARDAEAADRIRVKLSDEAPNPHARFFDFAIDTQGLGVTVL